jgi:hypothetical protein
MPIVLFAERVIVQAVAAPLPSSWQKTGCLGLLLKACNAEGKNNQDFDGKNRYVIEIVG